MKCSTGKRPSAADVVPRPGYWVPVPLGQPKLLGAREHVAGLAGVEVQVVAQPEEEGVGRLDGVVVFLAQHAAIAKFAEIGSAVASEADPAQQLQIAERALGSLDVRFQEEDRLAVAMPFRIARLS